ncbi:MAG: RNA 2',3'-cyclic phosphodiesterase [Pseudomonadales bacterium]
MRLFFGLELAPADLLAIDSWRSRTCAALGPGVPAENLHITLAFAGECAPAKLEALCDAAQALQHECFSLHFDDLGYWARQGLVWLGVSEQPAALQKLARDCRSLVGSLQLHKARKPFTPHISLWRGQGDAPPAPLQQPDFTMAFDSFVLFESTRNRRGGVQYAALARWPLKPVMRRSGK